MDSDYIKKVIAGDSNAFRYFVEKYSDKAHAVAFSMVRNNVLVDDIVQDSFFKAYQKLDSFRGDAQFATWFMRIVVNESIKVLRKKKVKIDNEETLKIDIEESDINNSLNDLKHEEQRKYIDLVLEKLPRREALMLQLYYLQEHSLKEIEEIMELNQDHLKVILYRSRRRFYKLLELELKHELTTII